MVMDTRTVQFGGHILRQDFSGNIPSQTCPRKGLQGTNIPMVIAHRNTHQMQRFILSMMGKTNCLSQTELRLAYFMNSVFLFFLTLACLGTIIFQCLPIKAIWEQELQPPLGNARCYSNSVYRSISLFNGCMFSRIEILTQILTSVAIHIFTDVLFASLPLPVILTLQINVRTKATLMAILSIGYLYVKMS